MSRPDQSRPRLEAGLILLLIMLWLIPWLPRFHGPIDLRWDAAVYYSLGTALAQGKGYRLLNEPGEIAAIQYPPGLPSVVALHQWTLGTSDPVIVGVALRRFYFVLSGLYVASVYWLLRRPFGPPAAFAGAAICALSMTLVWVSDRCYSDLPFLLATTTFLLLARQPISVARFSAGIAAVAAFLLRTLGAALLIAWVVDAALARRWRRCAAGLLLTVLLVGGWQGYVWMIERSPEYQAPAYPYQRAPSLMYNVSYRTNFLSLKHPFFPEQGLASRRDVFNRFLSNAAGLPGAVGEVLSTSADNWSESLEGIRGVPVLGLLGRWRVIRAGLTLLGLLALAGLWLLWRTGQIRESLFTVIYILAVCAMTFNEEFGRYLSGIEPLLIMALFTTLLGTRSQPSAIPMRRSIFAVIVLAIVLGEGTTLRKAYADGFSPVTHRQWRGHDVTYRLFSYADTFRSFDAAIDWINGHAADNDVIASSQPHWVYLRTGRRAVMPPFERDLGRQQALLDSVPVSYVIVDSDGFSATREYSLPVLRSEERWERVYHSADGLTEVYRRRGE